jgi:hypothetical protein
MNQIRQNNCEYVRPNITIEVISVINNCTAKIYYVYNYKGISFRLFSSKKHLEGFLDNLSLEYHHFEKEDELDNYLNQLKLS